MDIDISNNKYSNIQVTNKTRINNFNFGNYDNIVYINNVINTDNNNILTLNKSNTTYIIKNIEEFIYKKDILEIQKNDKDTFISPNHNLKKNDIIKLYNIRILENGSTTTYINLLNDILQNTNITYKVINTTRNTFTLISSNNSSSNLNNISNILKTSSKNIVNAYFELVSNKSNVINKNVNINIDNNNTDDYGIYYNLIIDTTIDELKINILNNDKFNGYINFNSQELISQDYIEIANNKSVLNIKNVDLKHSRFELVNIAKNEWFIKGNIFNNTIYYKLSYDSTITNYKIDDEPISIKHFYKNYVYVIDISDPSLLNYLFIILDNNNKHYYKNIIKCGEMGISNSYIKIYISNDETLENIYQLKYKKQLLNTFYTFISLYIIKPTPISFF